jgi:hypothetical protein
MADPKTIAGMVQILGLAELLIGSNVVPALTALFKTHYELTPSDQAALDEGLHQLMLVKAKILAARRALDEGGGTG